MKLFVLIGLLLAVPAGLSAQTDSVAVPSVAPIKTIGRHTMNKALRMTFISVPLIVGGTVMMSYDKDFCSLRNGFARSFDQSYDDYLQYAPAMLMVGMKAFGYKSRSSWGRMLVSDAFSAGLMAIAVNSLKYSVKIQRPDGRGHNSFPSGHTATAFMTATMLHKEYGNRSPWFSIGGYTIATVVGVTRQLNNRHWMSDTMVGAGIGILTTELGYFLADLIFKDRGLNFITDPYAVFDRYRKPSFFGIDLAFSTVLGEYRPRAGMDINFTTGPTVSLQGAWFATPYLGVGGRFSVSNINVEVNGVAQTGHFESASASGGLYLSYPISARCLIGGKLLGGYEMSKSCKTDAGVIGGNRGFVFGTGVSMTYVAYQNLGVRFTTDYDIAPSVLKNPPPSDCTV